MGCADYTTANSFTNPEFATGCGQSIPVCGRTVNGVAPWTGATHYPVPASIPRAFSGMTATLSRVGLSYYSY